MEYNIFYCSSAYKDLEDIALYITHTLKAPKAAMNLLDNFEHSIFRLKKFPYSCRIYRSMRKLDDEYRILPVNNYLVFYTVQEECKTVEIRRILYSKMDINKFFDRQY